MGKRDVFTKVMAVAGTLLACFPILATVLFSAVRFAQSGMFRFDYLLPAELFPAALAGGILLIWAALRAHSQQKLISWSLLIAVGLLVGGQALAVASGLASGEIEPAGWPWVLVLASIAGYSLALIGMDIGGVLLLRDLFRPAQQ